MLRKIECRSRALIITWLPGVEQDAGPGHPTQRCSRDCPAIVHHRYRRDVLSYTVTLRLNGRLHHIGICKARTGTRVLLLVADLNVRIITSDTGQLLRELTLDYQPSGVRLGSQLR